MRRALLGFIVTLLASAPMADAEGWAQLGGGPERSGVAALSGPLDVLSSFRIVEEDEILGIRYANGLVATPHGAVGLAVGPEYDCRLVWIEDPLEGRVRRGDEFACVWDRMGDGLVAAAYSPLEDLVVICAANTNGPLLHAFEAATGKLRWQVTAGELGALGADQRDWRCTLPVVDEARGRIIVPITVGTRNRVSAVGLADGALLWTTTIGAVHFSRLGVASPVAAADSAPFTAWGATVGAHGILVNGMMWLPDGRPGIAWLDHDGRVTAALSTEDTPYQMWVDRQDTACHDGSVAGSAQGDLIAAVLGPNLQLVDPRVATTVVIPLTEVEPISCALLPPPIWRGSDVIVPAPRSIAAYDTVLRAPRWTWLPTSPWEPAHMLLTHGDDIHVLAKLPAQGTYEVALLRLDAVTGTLLQRVPLPLGSIRTPNVGYDLDRVSDRDTPIPWSARLLPLADGQLLAFHDTGLVALLGPAPEGAPLLSADDAYPPPGGLASLRLDGEGATSILVAWGDGHVEAFAPRASVTHAYAGPGDYTARVTAIFEDGRTRTQEATFHVGGTPPLAPAAAASSGFMQRLFGPETWEITVTIATILASSAGAFVAFLARRRRRSSLARALDRLERIEQRIPIETAWSARALGTFREEMKRNLQEGRLDDAQYNALESRARVAYESLRARVLGPLSGRVSANFQHLLDVSLLDGRMEAAELRMLRAGLRHEMNLSEAERAGLASIFDVWGENDPDSVGVQQYVS